MNTSMREQRGAGLLILLLALAAVIGVILMGQGLSSVGKRAQAASANEAAFETLHLALAQFVMINRRLPCPASGVPNAGGEDVVAPTNTTACQSPSGVVPWTTLGLPQSAAIDSWGRMIGYRVYDGATGFTRTDGMKLIDCLDEDVTAEIPLSGAACNATTHENARSDFFVGKGVTVNDRGIAVTRVAYVLISHGDTGLGAYVPTSATPMTAPAGASKEFLNAGSSGTYWILAPSDPTVPADDAAHFDDAVSYRTASATAVAARSGGRPWPLAALLTTAKIPNNNYNTGMPTAYSTDAGQGIKITASGDSTRYVCVVSNSDPSFEGVSACTALALGGSDLLTSSSNELLTFEFRVKRRYLRIRLSEFGRNGSNYDTARLTFFNGATSVQIDKNACINALNANAEFLIDPGQEFTRVEVRAIDATTSSDFSVNAISACRYSDAPNCPINGAGTFATTCP